MDKIVGRHWHHISAYDCVQILGSSSEKGLPLFEVKHRQDRFGANEFAAKKSRNPFRAFLKQFAQPLVYLLVLAAAVTLILAHYVDAAVIFGMAS